MVRLIQENKDWTTRGVLKLRRRMDNLFRGTKSTQRSDALVTQLRNNLNKVIGGADETFRQASKAFAETKKFLDQLGLNIVGKAKLNVDQTATKLFQLAKDLDDPFRREGAEKLLIALEERSGIPFIGVLRALATAENLNPQKAQGIRAGVVREMARIIEVALSEVVGVAGKINIKVNKLTPEFVKGIDFTGNEVIKNSTQLLFWVGFSNILREE